VDDHTAGDRDDEKNNTNDQKHGVELPDGRASQPLKPPEAPKRAGAPGRGDDAADGVDPIVSLRDNGDIDRDQIPEVLAWAAGELIGAALREAQTNDGLG
jgi:hypothetical protein